jgi:cell division protein FtsB
VSDATNDLTTRLRHRAWDGAEWDETLTAAAAEIERLRATIIELRAEIQRLEQVTR